MTHLEEAPPGARPAGGSYDEARASSGEPRPHYAAVLDFLAGEDLDAIARGVRGDLTERGVTFRAGGRSEPFAVDPVPRVVEARDWARLECGLVQRVRALDAFVADVYGKRRIVAEGIVPPRVIESAAHHEPSLHGVSLPRGGAIPVAGLDVVRGDDGEWLVLEDNVRTPSGIAYALAARDAVDGRVPAPAGRIPLDPRLPLLRAALWAAAPPSAAQPSVALLSDGPASSAWWEHGALATILGIPIVTLDGLSMRSDGLHAEVDGRPLRVDVLYRRTDEDRLADDHGRPTPIGRILLPAIRSGLVSVVNPFGTGVADDKLTHAYVEAMIRFYLGEEPLVRSVPTYDVGDPTMRASLLGRLDEIVIKPRAASGGHGVFIGPHATDHERRAMAEEIDADPEAFVAQDLICLSRHPTVVDGRLEPRHVDLRAFVLTAGDRTAVLPGGLTRVALEAGSMVVNSSQRGGGKATWVLSD